MTGKKPRKKPFEGIYAESGRSLLVASAFRVAIIGGGYSGTMLAVALQKTLPKTAQIIVFGRDPAFARGVAYAQADVPYLLNVRARNMSAFADDPEHFYRWLDTNTEGNESEIKVTAAGVFVSRRFYGRYLQEIVREAQGLPDKARLELYAGDVVRLERLATGWLLHGPQGERLEAQSVVLACGNLPDMSGPKGAVYTNPWAPEVLTGLTSDKPVLIVGTGLTMVDLVLGLDQAGFAGQIVALSRRGLLPQAHKKVETLWPTPAFSDVQRGSILRLFQEVRAQVKLARRQDVDWRAVIDSLRPITAALWRELPLLEQKRFLRHVRPYWDVHRHRMAPVIAEMLAQKQAAQQLRVVRGRVLGRKHNKPSGVVVEIANHSAGVKESLSVQRAVYATGIGAALGREVLLRALLADGLARPDALGMALDVTDSLAVRGRDGGSVPGLWALGSLVRGVFWESVAVPDIRAQIQRLSVEIAKIGADAVGEG